MTVLNNVNASVLERVIKEAEKLACERCPVVFALTKRVKLKTVLEVRK